MALGREPLLTDPHPVVTEQIERIGAVCAENGKAAGIFTNGAREGLRWAAAGFQLVCVNSDRLLMSERGGQILDEIRSRGSAR
jgi:2-keto-3-deoxy-L-rhamnonate aldolase RhmA